MVQLMEYILIYFLLFTLDMNSSQFHISNMVFCVIGLKYYR